MGPTFLFFPNLGQVRNMHNYPKIFLNSMHNEKNNIFILENDLESANKNHSLNSYVPKSNPHGEDEN